MDYCLLLCEFKQKSSHLSILYPPRSYVLCELLHMCIRLDHGKCLAVLLNLHSPTEHSQYLFWRSRLDREGHVQTHTAGLMLLRRVYGAKARAMYRKVREQGDFRHCRFVRMRALTHDPRPRAIT